MTTPTIEATHAPASGQVRVHCVACRGDGTVAERRSVLLRMRTVTSVEIGGFGRAPGAVRRLVARPGAGNDRPASSPTAALAGEGSPSGHSGPGYLCWRFASELGPHDLARSRRPIAPPVRDRGNQRQPVPRCGAARSRRHRRRDQRGVLDRDADVSLAAGKGDDEVRPRVHDRIGGQLGDDERSVVDQRWASPRLERVRDEVTSVPRCVHRPLRTGVLPQPAPASAPWSSRWPLTLEWRRQSVSRAGRCSSCAIDPVW